MRALVVTVLVLCAAPAVADEKATATGQLDFRLAEHGDTYVLRDDAYAITFPSKPTVKSLDFPIGDRQAHGVVATIDSADQDFSIVFKPIPRDMSMAAQSTLDKMRDDAFKAMGATLLSEKRIKLAGLDARQTLAKVTTPHGPVYVDFRTAWDVGHRTLIAIIAGYPSETPSPGARAFMSSFAITRGAAGPLDPPALDDGAATPTSVLDLQLVRHGSTFVLGDSALELTFPARPVVLSVAAAVPVATAIAMVDEGETFELDVAVVPRDQVVDPARGVSGALDGILKMFDHPHTSAVDARIAGLAGRRVTISGERAGVPVHGEVDIAWDPVHHILFSAIATTHAASLPAAAHAFLASLRNHPAGAAPSLPPAK